MSIIIHELLLKFEALIRVHNDFIGKSHIYVLTIID
jgi:hypothetical protein